MRAILSSVFLFFVLYALTVLADVAILTIGTSGAAFLAEVPLYTDASR